jgi:hypothetical protein
MNTERIVEALDMEIRRLQMARDVLAGLEAAKPSQRLRAIEKHLPEVAAGPVKRKISDAARAKMAVRQQARWDKVRQAFKRSNRKSPLEPVAETTPVKKVTAKVSSAKASTPIRLVPKKSAHKSIVSKPTAKKVLTKNAGAANKQPSKKVSVKNTVPKKARGVKTIEPLAPVVQTTAAPSEPAS